MRTNSLLSLAMLLTLSSCSALIDRESVSQDETPYAVETSALNGCTAHSDCATPFDGVPVNCTGSTACAPFPDRVICDGRTTLCHSLSPPCMETLVCESGPTTLSCTGRSCTTLGPVDSKVCGGVVCDGIAQFCPPLPGDLECF
jgi:hypothetical protein